LYKKKLEKLGFEFQDPNDFIEDEEVSLKEAIISVDGILNKNPQMIFESDPDLEALVDELIEGVDIA
jgi:23S rRNA maturation-related 3'-5' exoribonuclease YhaM